MKGGRDRRKKRLVEDLITKQIGGRLLGAAVFKRRQIYEGSGSSDDFA